MQKKFGKCEKYENFDFTAKFEKKKVKSEKIRVTAKKLWKVKKPRCNFGRVKIQKCEKRSLGVYMQKNMKRKEFRGLFAKKIKIRNFGFVLQKQWRKYEKYKILGFTANFEKKNVKSEKNYGKGRNHEKMTLGRLKCIKWENENFSKVEGYFCKFAGLLLWFFAEL